MIFADKLIRLRKRSGWSQEELAEQMEVTRQSVSKWESAQSIPDIDKILRLAALFGVSTDYLLREEIEEEQPGQMEEPSTLRRVTLQQANEFMAVKQQTAPAIAGATLLCILSPICLLLLGVLSERGIGLPENVVGGVGMIVMLILVAIAVVIFLSCGSKTAEYDFLEKEPFEVEYGVTGLVKERQTQYKRRYDCYNCIGVCCCILSLIPLFGAVIIDEKNDLLIMSAVCLLLVLCGIGVTFFIRGGIIWESFRKLLQQGEYDKRCKQRSAVKETVSTIYWLLLTAIYIGYSMTTGRWHTSWIIWVVGGLLFPALSALLNIANGKNEKKD